MLPLLAALQSLSALAALALPATSGGAPVRALPAHPNILLVVLDDVGADGLASYGIGGDYAPTPTLDALVQQGVRFTRAYANPTCSPTRATYLTGRYGQRTLVGKFVNKLPAGGGLGLDELQLPRMLPPRYTTSFVGKWHMNANPEAATAAAQYGWDDYAGNLFNLVGNDHYADWPLTENGTTANSTEYITTWQVDRALERIRLAEGPWFCVLSFFAAHGPWQFPPAELHTQSQFGTNRIKYKATLEAADKELGRLLEQVDLAETLVVVLGDNGTPGPVIWKFQLANKAKTTVWEHGVHVPLIVAGAGVTAPPGSTCDALVQSVDLTRTLVELAGGDASPALDSISFLPQLGDPSLPGARERVWVEFFSPNGPGPYQVERYAVRDDEWKYMLSEGVERLFHLAVDPGEFVDLIADPDPAVQSKLTELRLAARAYLQLVP